MIPTDKYVLSRFSDEEINNIKENFEKFNEIIEAFITGGIESVLKINNN